jgi:hypothetical protein
LRQNDFNVYAYKVGGAKGTPPPPPPEFAICAVDTSSYCDATIAAELYTCEDDYCLTCSQAHSCDNSCGLPCSDTPGGGKRRVQDVGNCDAVGGGTTIVVNPDFMTSLSDEAAWADCWLTPDEIESNPEASAIASAFAATVAAVAEVDPSTVLISGMSWDSVSVDGESGPGCSADAGGDTVGEAYAWAQGIGGWDLGVLYTISCTSGCSGVDDAMRPDSESVLVLAQSIIDVVNGVGAAEGFENVVMNTVDGMPSFMITPTCITVPAYHGGNIMPIDPFNPEFCPLDLFLAKVEHVTGRKR